MHAQLFWHNAELNNSGDLKSWPWARAASFSPSCFQRQENVYRQSKLLVVMSSSVPPGGAQPSTHREHTVDVSHQQLVSCWVVGEKNTITSLGANFHRFKNRSSSSAYFVSQCFWQWPFFLPSQRATGHVCCLQISAMLAACDWMDCTKPTEQCLQSFLRAFIIKQHIGFPSQAVRLWGLQSLQECTHGRVHTHTHTQINIKTTCNESAMQWISAIRGKWTLILLRSVLQMSSEMGSVPSPQLWDIYANANCYLHSETVSNGKE